MAPFRSLKWIAGAFVALVALAALFIGIAGWNWLRGPVGRLALEKTGRVLAIHGNLDVRFAMRAIGAMALSVVNPFLTLLPLIGAGPGKDSDCGQLVREARALPHAVRKP